MDLRRHPGWRRPSLAANWLFVTIETCSISIRLDSDDPAAVVATALFGDGAAAAVVTAGEHSLARITGAAEKLWPDTLSGSWAGTSRTPDLRSSSTARFRRSSKRISLRPSTKCAASSALHVDDIDRFCCHPGGVKVIDAIETALDLNQGELNLEREVLRDFGNMSAPTVLFVLERLLEAGPSRSRPDDRFRTGFHLRGAAIWKPREGAE